MSDLSRRTILAAPASAPLLMALQTAPRPDDAPPFRHLLSAGRSAADIGKLLLPREQWRPYPTAAERAAWQALPADTARQVVASAEALLGQPWPSLPASVFLDFARNGNRTRWEKLHFDRRNRLRSQVLAECIEGKGRFLDDILDGLWLLCEETFWGVSAHIGAQRAGKGLPDVSENIVDLFAAETGNAVAWADYLLAPQLERISPLLRPRLLYEVERRLLTPLLTRIDFGWMGTDPKAPRRVNNWNPWIVSNWLTCTLLMEPDPARRAASVQRALVTVDRFLDAYNPDGGCDEGPGYWSRAGASLFDCLELLYSATAAKLDYYPIPLVKEIGRYIYRAHIAGNWYTNFADASARVNPDANLVWRYGTRIGDPVMAAHGAWLAAGKKPEQELAGGAMGRSLDSLFHLKDLRAAATTAQAPMVRDVFLPGTHVFAARMKAGSKEGFYVAAQGGHNAESHNHNDVGNFIVFHDGEPVLIDVGVETYTAKTFSAQRYDIWTMQSAWHNTPAVNGIMQNAGRQYEAHAVSSKSDDTAASFELNIERAYPAAAGIQSWRRAITLNRAAGHVQLQDTFQLSKAAPIELYFITTREARPAGPGQITLAGGFALSFDPSLQPFFDEHSSQDPRLLPNWGPVVRRIRLVAASSTTSGKYTVTIKKS
ncbi:MAG: heparinase II/III family protein [Bryobacterales bacterium]|nr:heparinase II/III family protein [Bryobacterales bacterium]